MPVRLIPNQLVKLYETENFNEKNKRVTQDYRTYCQMVRDEQTTMFQVQLLPDQDSLITNGDFTDDISGWQNVEQTWQWASGRLQGIKSSNGTPNIYQQVSTTIGRAYKLTYTIQFTNLTSFLTVVVGQGASQSWVYTASDYGLDAFTVEVFWISDLAHADIIFLLSGNMRDMVFIDDVAVERLSEPTARLEDCDGNNIESLSVYARMQDYITFKVEWYGKSEGCYRVCLEGVDDLESNYLDYALALGTEGGAALELEQGGFIKWYG